MEIHVLKIGLFEEKRIYEVDQQKWDSKALRLRFKGSCRRRQFILELDFS